ncbi:phosphatidylinositol-specific phospholipase C/glycerophosphodiester phosphodiesterase family protein [Nocardioides koreensis]|uniref:Altered inheritance of mitochondria protein 6 n=1 Tax=Nocardioides koreensis TaxID=433651 RepID=A0ABN2ZQG6_9ACTN
MLDVIGATQAAAGVGPLDELIADEVDGLVTTYPERLHQVGDEDVRPLPLAHAHNDYDHAWPLLDALDHGFTSIEADVWLVDGKLLVAHDRDDVLPVRSLERLYLSPLERLQWMNGDSIYPGWHGSLELLIDVKSKAGPTYAALDRALRRHPGLMTSYTGDQTHRRAVTAVVTGRRDRAMMAAQPLRYAGYDGRLSDLLSHEPASLVPLVSVDWTRTFTWDGNGPMPAGEKQRLRDLVATAHADGFRLRFWETPDEPGPARAAIWRQLVQAGVDQINTDDLGGLERFLSR